MRILPYESAAVKVRVQARAVKLGHFHAADRRHTRIRGLFRMRAGSARGITGIWEWTRDMTAPDLRFSRRFGKVCPKSRTRLSDTDVERVHPTANSSAQLGSRMMRSIHAT